MLLPACGNGMVPRVQARKCRYLHSMRGGVQVSVGSSWADFADALALSKLGAARIEGCQLASATEGASQHPDALVSHIDALLDNVFQV